MIYEDHAGSVTAMVIVLTIVGFVSFILRLLVRMKHAAWGVDDTCMAIGAVGTPVEAGNYGANS